MSFPPLYLPATAPEFYDQLAKLYWPHPLQDDLGYQQALEVLEWVSPQAFSKDQRLFLWMLRDRIKAYEAQRGEPRWCGVPGPHLREGGHLAQEQQ